MSNDIEKRIMELGIELPPAAKPAANYVPFIISGNFVFIAGQLPMHEGKVSIVGKLGIDVSVEDGQAAARLCALNILAQAKAAADGDLNRVKSCIKLGGFVNSSADFKDHALIMNGASDLISEVLSERGFHARFAVGAASLPFDAAVEVDGMFELY